jgi:Protein of unknown function (DUF1161)
MRAWLTVAAVLLVSASSYAQGTKPCEDLKSEIAQKLEAKNVKGYSLEIVEKDKDAGDGKMVGSCEGGAKKIIYSKTATTPQSPTKETSKP